MRSTARLIASIALESCQRDRPDRWIDCSDDIALSWGNALTEARVWGFNDDIANACRVHGTPSVEEIAHAIREIAYETLDWWSFLQG